MTPVEFRGDLWRQKTRVLRYRVVLFVDPIFSRFRRTPTCDRQTQTQADTGRHRPMASTADA